MEPSRTSRSFIDDSRLSALLFVGILLALALLALRIPGQRRAEQAGAVTEEQALMEALHTVLPSLPASEALEAAGPCCPSTTLMPDQPGSRDLAGIPPFPDARRLGNRILVRGLVQQALYQTRSPPSSVAVFYHDWLTADGWQLERLEPMNPGGHGWFVLFRSSDGVDMAAVFASSQWFDMPPGAEGNPTWITVDRTNLSVENVAKAMGQGNVASTSP